MNFKHLNRDIKVSVVFTILTYIILVIIGVYGFRTDTATFFRVLVLYGFPISLLAIFFSRTAIRVELDEANQRAIDLSFKLAIAASAISLIALIITSILS